MRGAVYRRRRLPYRPCRTLRGGVPLGFPCRGMSIQDDLLGRRELDLAFQPLARRLDRGPRTPNTRVMLLPDRQRRASAYETHQLAIVALLWVSMSLMSATMYGALQSVSILRGFGMFVPASVLQFARFRQYSESVHARRQATFDSMHDRSFTVLRAPSDTKQSANAA